ncbi:MAG: hypothetical protein AB1752_06105 [Candidatus Zixiibacteriota bacterium]
MIVVRDIFQLHFGKARDAKAAMKDALPLMAKAGAVNARLLTDVTGPYYTLVLEANHADLAAWQTFEKKGLAMTEWQEIYKRFVPLVQSGRREIFSVVD